MTMRAHVARMMDPVLQVLLFQVGGVRYGIPLGQVIGLIEDLDREPGAAGIPAPQMIDFEGRSVPMLLADEFILELGPRLSRGREAVVLDNGGGPYCVVVDRVESVVEVVPGDGLYLLPPLEDDDASPRAWGVLTVAERPVLLLDLSHASMH